MGLVCHHVNEATPQRCAVTIVSDIAGAYDLVLVAVRADQIRNAMEPLRLLSGSSVVLVFGNNPGGIAKLHNELPVTIRLGFPGIGGAMMNGVAEYMRIAQQPTTLESCADPAIAAFETALSHRGFDVTRTADMGGWLIYHAVFVASISAALYRHAVARHAETEMLTLPTLIMDRLHDAPDIDALRRLLNLKPL